MGAVMPEPEYEIPLVADSDAAVYVLSRISGEGNDRKAIPGDVLLTKTEIRDILKLNETYEKFMLVINTGGPVDLSSVTQVNNILILSQLGVVTGIALADILLGKANPSGKLTTTWSAWQDYCPDVDFGNADDTYYREGIYVGYRYFDTIGKKALFPFGFGLSYTTFELQLHHVKVKEQQITLGIKVENTGNCVGKEVVQLYVSVPAGKLDQPYQVLAGFAKTGNLAPGASEVVNIEVEMSDLASYDTKQAVYLLEQGEYILRMGNSSVNTKPVAIVELDSTIITKRVRNILPPVDFEDKQYQGVKEDCISSEVQHFTVTAGDFTMEEVACDREGTILPEISKLTDEELIYLNVGAFNPKGGMLSVIGNASKSVCGAAGETTDVLREQGISYLVMADGPAGLRLTQKFYRDQKGVHGIDAAGMPESIMEFMPGVLRFLTRLLSGGQKNAPKGQTVEYQYATAIPIGTALAQSWNLDFAKACGDIVGAEMERFGVHLWLAPALNIHRSILCGRNFEYFSEDPLISGKFAAAITQGVQSHPGCGTTIKHYAANNQETNRMNSNSHVSERAMREIYLRGFGICVKESQPHGVMTSYNLVNGTHTAESRGLTQDYLRAEHDYQGIVMTDWVVQGASASKHPKYRGTRPYLVAAAGGDLFMPGSKGDYEDMLEALKNGSLSRKQLEINGSRLVRKIRQMTGGAK
jgi:beta-glucosidase